MSAGAAVRSRGTAWRLRSSVAYEDCVELRLESLHQPDARILLWPFDRISSIDGPESLRAVRLRRVAAALASTLDSARDTGGLAAPSGAVRVLPYQLEPALAVASGETRVLLADEVGLGKTIEAGWIVSDLLARNPHARVLIATPAGLRAQWQSELATLFDINTTLVDARCVRRAISELPPDVSPWTIPGVYVISLDFLKRQDITAGVARHIWDLLIVDEAHTAAAPTDRYRAIDAIAAGTRTIVTISATPFSGDPAAFASLGALGGGTRDSPLMFRRSREDVGLATRRRLHFATVRLAAPERRFERLLDRYAREVWGDPSSGADGRLAVTILRKRALSCASAGRRSLQRRLDLLDGRAQVPLQLPLFDEDSCIEDEEPIGALAAPGLRDRTREHQWLASLVDAARRAASYESKCRYLQRLLRRVGREPAIVFTEYRDTLSQLAGLFPGALLLHGGMAHGERESVQRTFNETGGLLLATDAAAEGLNLQHRCRLAVNFELPWNPARLQQRIGRVDRIGQRRPVHAIALVARHTAEELVIANIVRRLERVAATLGERDRLFSFLDDLRVARAVIGGASDVSPVAESLPICVRTAPPDPRREVEAARRRLVARLGHVRPMAPAPHAVAVASLHASRMVPPGAIMLFRWTAADAAGTVWTRAVVPVHVSFDLRSARTAAEARETAARVLATHRAAAEAAVRNATRGALEEASAAHATVLRRLRQRELEIAAPTHRSSAIQAGLFDRRAVTQADERHAIDVERQREHRTRQAALECPGPLLEQLEVFAVLLSARR